MFNKKQKEGELVEREIHDAFLVGVILKGCNALLEVVLGTLLLFTHVVTNTIIAFINYALVQDPDNFFSTHLSALANLTPQAQFFGALYLLAHGIVKIFLVVGLLRKRAWAYPASITVLSLFMFYELVRTIQTNSIAILLLTIFDGVVVWLIWHEYSRIQKAKRLIG